ncbi:MAG: DUF4405 domain-containing protein [Oscillospiraceae bacterium]|nr:DUF4405 domain-containing protein [Oscillospiraceae bacterium]
MNKPKNKSRRTLSAKAVLSILLLLGFLFMALTGALLYFGKTGMLWGIPRGAWRQAHAVAALALCALVVAHLVLNRRILWRELCALFGRK